jgi:C4-dicarboxylate-specific signal transduction histidine kinase
LNASVHERRQTEVQLLGLSNQLEVRVQKRTAELAHSAKELAEKIKSWRK